MSFSVIKVVRPALTRLLDIVISSSSILALSPLLVFIVAALRLTGEKEVFFVQQRVGRNGMPIKIIKFATMLKNSPNMDSGEITLAQDRRVLPFGRFLRKTKINELPQLYNVLMGDLSLIGPRPQTQTFFDCYNEADRAVIIRYRPGISGVGSIFFRDEESLFGRLECPVEFDRKVITPFKGILESWYFQKYSVRLYFYLIVLTLLAILFPGKLRIDRVFKDLPDVPNELKILMD